MIFFYKATWYDEFDVKVKQDTYGFVVGDSFSEAAEEIENYFGDSLDKVEITIVADERLVAFGINVEDDITTILKDRI